MQIPLDYYRVIGVPLQADSDLINLAYEDRIMQMPRHEYSDSAIASRQDLIKQAYNVLRNEKSRQIYDEQLFPPHTESVINGDTETQMSVSDAITLDQREIPEPTIDIDNNLLIGSLILLQELGEYELVLTIAQPYLEGKEKLAQITNNTDELRILWQDLVLTVTNAYLDLARENWQQQEYESASNNLTSAYNLLDTENLFNNLRKEIDLDIHKLRPYEVVELLSKENSELKDRQRAIAIVEKMLNSRGGIEGAKEDKSGLDKQSFLQFIQQIRTYLTPLEQEYLFEKESKRPSYLATHLYTNILITRGFTEKNPELIIKAKRILNSLHNYQDIALEGAVCNLLLGNIIQAEKLVEQSQENNKVKYIKENSQGSPDLVPGLILYTEKWLETEVFTKFKNLNQESSSVQKYFDNSRVQNYLEKISPSDVDLNTLDQETDSFISDLPEVIHDPNNENLTLENEEFSTTSKIELNTEKPPAMNLFASNYQTEESELIGLNSFLKNNLQEDSFDNSQKSENNNGLYEEEVLTEDELLENIENASKTNPKTPLIGLLIFILLLSFLSFLVYRLWNRSSSTNNLQISLTEPLIQLPEEIAAQDLILAENPLTAQTALSLVRQWLEAKAQGTGPNYNIDALETILTDPLLTIWRGNIIALRNQNAYRRYEHDIAIEGVSVNPQNNNQGNITARVKENSQFFRNGNLDNSRSYEEDLLVRYDLIKINNQWFIRNTEIIN